LHGHNIRLRTAIYISASWPHSQLPVHTACRQVRRPSQSSAGGPGGAGHAAAGDLKFREKFLIRLINIGDREDEEGIRWSFELCQRDQQRVILKVRVSP
jgi:hypothetical protein